MARIAFLHSATQPYTGQTLRAGPLRGVQSGTVLLSEALVERGHDVTVFNSVAAPSDYAGVRYRPFAHAAGAQADLFVANNNPRDFDVAPGGSSRRALWMRNPTNVWRLWKKNNLGPMLRHRPDGVFLSKSHDAAVSRLIPFRSRRIIELGTDPVFLGAVPSTAPRPPVAVFYSEFYRGLDWVLEVWRRHVNPAAPEAELHIFGDLKGRASDYFAGSRIRHHPPTPKKALAAFLRSARTLLFQGHRDEAGCNTAIESFASGLPIVTVGIGVLGERVEHGVTGLIGKTPEAFGAETVRMLTDDGLWLSMHPQVMRHSSVRPWSHRAAQWEQAFLTA